MTKDEREKLLEEIFCYVEPPQRTSCHTWCKIYEGSLKARWQGNALKVISRLEERVGKLEEALRFYADHTHWCATQAFGPFWVTPSSDIDEVHGYPTGGKIAREALAQGEEGV
jgi:hypothetical protein